MKSLNLLQRMALRLCGVKVTDLPLVEKVEPKELVIIPVVVEPVVEPIYTHSFDRPPKHTYEERQQYRARNYRLKRYPEVPLAVRNPRKYLGVVKMSFRKGVATRKNNLRIKNIAMAKAWILAHFYLPTVSSFRGIFKVVNDLRNGPQGKYDKEFSKWCEQFPTYGEYKTAQHIPNMKAFAARNGYLTKRMKKYIFNLKKQDEFRGYINAQNTSFSVKEERYGSWTITGPSQKVGGVYKAPCQCECGTKRLVVADNLVRGRSTNCGCKSKAWWLAPKRAA